MGPQSYILINGVSCQKGAVQPLIDRIQELELENEMLVAEIERCDEIIDSTDATLTTVDDCDTMCDGEE